MNLDRPVGIGIVGLGRVSAAHIDGYLGLPGEARITAVCDPNDAAREPVSHALDVPGHRDHRALLAQTDVDAVVLLLPHRLHHPVAIDALEAGKHVTIEKPMALSTSECRALILAAARRKLVLSVSENTRFVNGYLEVDRMLRAGQIGQIRLVRAFIYGSALKELSSANAFESWKLESTGFAAILDAAPHFFYLFKWMLGDVASIQAVARHWACYKGIPTFSAEDGAVITGTFTGGGHFTVELALNVEIPWGERLEIYGDVGSVICDQLSNPPVMHYTSATEQGTPVETVPFDPWGWRHVSIHRGAADFVRAIREGRPPTVRAEEAAYAVALAEAAYHSVARGGLPVDVSDCQFG